MIGLSGMAQGPGGRVKSRRQTPLRPLINGVCRLRALLLAPSQCLCVVNKVLLFKHVQAWQFSFCFEMESPGPRRWEPSNDGKSPQDVGDVLNASRVINRSRLPPVCSAGGAHEDASTSPPLSHGAKTLEEAWCWCSVWGPGQSTPVTWTAGPAGTHPEGTTLPCTTVVYF